MKLYYSPNSPFARNPLGQVPTLETSGGEAIADSQISRYSRKARVAGLR